MKQIFFYLAICLAFFLTSCTPDDSESEYEHTNAYFQEELGCQIGMMQWWETSVTIQVNVEANTPTRIWLTSAPKNGILYDYKEVPSSGIVSMTAPQGQGNTIYLSSLCRNKLGSQPITLSGKPIETVDLNPQKSAPALSPAEPDPMTYRSHPASLCGNSILGNAEYYTFNGEELESFRTMMANMEIGGDYVAYLPGASDDYELSSNGPFQVIWASGWEASQAPHILGYYHHSPGTYNDIEYVDISETHKWDYIDGLSKLQYQIDMNDEVAGIHFYPGQWYDANFDMYDRYGSTSASNPDRVGDSAFNIRIVFDRYHQHLSAFRGIAFEVDVPVGNHIGFYLRADSEPFPDQWALVKSEGIPPYVSNQALFRGTCFSAKDLNVGGNRRSIIWDAGAAIWMGMEDFVVGGDNDCDDVIFCVMQDMEICKPDIILPDVVLQDIYDTIFPWTLAFEDVYRDADFDFNDAVIKLVPDYNTEQCCVTAMAVGSTENMYLYYDGPNGEVCLGEMHKLLGNTGSDLKYINTQQSTISTPTVLVDCVPWPKDYSMEQDARRFSIRVQRGTCEDCADTLSLPSTPGELPEALLVAGEWNWPTEKTFIGSAYSFFPKWSQDPSNTTYWEWYKSSLWGTTVSH
jgi:hypothetical protein